MNANLYEQFYALHAKYHVQFGVFPNPRWLRRICQGKLEDYVRLLQRALETNSPVSDYENRRTNQPFERSRQVA